MEAENIDDLLVKYLFNECDAEENKIVLRWINASEQNRFHYEELKKTVELLLVQGNMDNSINIDAEWKHLQHLIAGNTLTIAKHPEEKSGTAETVIASGEEFAGENNKGSKKIYRFLISAAAAAAVIAAIYMGGFFSNSNNNNLLAVADSESVEKISPANAVVHHETNSTGQIKSFGLPDGSQVRLSANSELTYSEPAGGNQRNVFLKGEADFAVAKDKTKPFTVFSGDISTMAVGTRFTVTDFNDDKFIQVKLDEGKVLVKAEKRVNNKLPGDFYLLPGQRLIYDKNAQTAKIKSSVNDNKNTAATARAGEKNAVDNPELPKFNKSSWFMFNNQSLIEIFHSLELMYDIKIEYAKKDVDQRYFIGTFSKSDSVETILKQIAVLNKLTVTRKDNVFVIQKNK